MYIFLYINNNFIMIQQNLYITLFWATELTKFPQHVMNKIYHPQSDCIMSNLIHSYNK